MVCECAGSSGQVLGCPDAEVRDTAINDPERRWIDVKFEWWRECRSLGNFNINQPQDRMPPAIVRAFGILKGAAATVNMNFGLGKCGTMYGKG